jgi:signal transduction histidine kinase
MAGRPDDCLAGGGELGALMRAKDWSKTPLGPVASWPQSLRTSVSIMLSSGFAVVVAWGPEFLFLYNDRYRPVLGATKHPTALGSRTAEIFPEAWDVIGPRFRKALAGETVALDDVLIPLDRNGYLEECFFTLSYSPIRDESGGVGGLLAIVAETSKLVQGERRVRTLRDLAAIAPRAQTADQACENAVHVLAQNSADVPFATLFLVQPDGRGARWVSRTGLDGDTGKDPAQWPLADAARTGHAVVVRDLPERFGALPGGVYPEATHTAVVLPLSRPGLDQPCGYLVAGVCPRRSLDDKYEGFFDLVAEHVATAITNALANESERKRTEALTEIERVKLTEEPTFAQSLEALLELRAAPSARGGRRASIAIVDDNSDMRDYLVRVLSACGEVQAFADGEKALIGVRAAPPDVVVTDVMVPNVDGFGLLHALRSDPRTKEVPIVMLSARAGEQARIEGAPSGADDYIVKPFSARELVARVAAQVELSRLRGVAAGERSTLEQLFLEAPAAIAIVRGPDHVFELANSNYCAMVGRTAEQLLGCAGREVLPELVEQHIWDLFDRIRATGQRYGASAFPVILERYGRRERGFFNCLAQPFGDESGDIDRILIFAVEITEQVVARERAEKLAVELQRANQAKDEFLAMLGHELRNPLAPIVTALRVMELRGVAGAERERSVIERQVEHLRRLVDDLMEVSRIVSGKVRLSTSAIELADVVAQAVEVTSPMFEQRHQRLLVSVPPVGLPVVVDSQRMTQVIGNLLTNACKYSDPQAEIRVAARQEGDDVVLRVEDFGTGIEPEMLGRVFDLFSQERQSIDRSRGGLGLGLAIVRNLVQMHGGTVSAQSEGRGRGATFTVRLPLSQRVANAHPDPSRARRPSLQRSDARRVLIVDDNRDAAEMLADLLASLGHVTKIAVDGPAALALVQDFVPDVALLDIGLPAMDGYDLARRLRSGSPASRARLFAVTGYGQAADRARSREAGFDGHFVKPLDLNAIVRAIEAQ